MPISRQNVSNLASNGGVNVQYVIIGASAAGLSAAETLRRLKPDAEITIISKEKDIAYSRCLITYYISGQIPKNGLYLRTPEQINKLNLNIVSPAEVVEVSNSTKSVRLADGRIISYDRLLVASGASPVFPDIPGLQGQGVYSLRTLSDADDIIAGLTGVNSAVILGDGLVSVTTAMALSSKGIKVSLVGIAPHILATFLDARAAQILQKKMLARGIELFLGQSFAEINRGQDGKLTGVTITGGKRINAEMAVIAVGVRPNLEFLKNTDLAVIQGLSINNYLETGINGIYAAGDAAQCFDYVRNVSSWQPLWPNAVEQGQIAAYNMAGKSRAYRGCTNMNSLNIDGIPVVCVGIANHDSPDYDTHFISDSDSTYEKLVFQGDRLVGFILLGKTEKAGVLTSLVFQQAVSPTQKEKLLKGNFRYTSVVGLTPVSF